MQRLLYFADWNNFVTVERGSVYIGSGRIQEILYNGINYSSVSWTDGMKDIVRKETYFNQTSCSESNNKLKKKKKSIAIVGRWLRLIFDVIIILVIVIIIIINIVTVIRSIFLLNHESNTHKGMNGDISQSTWRPFLLPTSYHSDDIIAIIAIITTIVVTFSHHYYDYYCCRW